MGPAKMATDLLSPQDFNQYVINRSREQSPYRDPSPRRSPVMMEQERPESYNIPTPLYNIGCQDLLQEDKCSYCGWLRKKRSSLILRWPRMYIVLHDGCLYYFRHEEAKSLSGKFALYGYNAVYRASEIPRNEAVWTFKIVHSHQEFKTYLFSASSEQEMKAWMDAIKKEMLRANGKSKQYISKVKQDASKTDDSNFYKDVESNIYDDASKFIPSSDYTKQCSIKRANEDSDDEIEEPLIHNPTIDERPALPLPFEHKDDVFPPPVNSRPESPPHKPPRIVNEPPSAPPRSRHDQHSNLLTSNTRQFKQAAYFRYFSIYTGTSKVQQLGAEIGLAVLNAKNHKKSPILKRKPSYERTDLPGPKSPSVERRFAPVDRSSIPSTSSYGSSSGSCCVEEELENIDTEEYWASVYFNDRDAKQRAHDIIQAIGEDGVYLVRPEMKGSGRVLVVFAIDQTKKYRIQNSDGVYFLAEKGYKDEVLENVLYYYYNEDLPTVGVRLKTPYRLHPKYKSLKF